MCACFEHHKIVKSTEYQWVLLFKGKDKGTNYVLFLFHFFNSLANIYLEKCRTIKCNNFNLNF